MFNPSGFRLHGECIVPATRHVLAWLDWKRLYAWTAQRRHYRRCTQPVGLQLPAAV